MSVLPPSCSAIASGRPPPRSRPLAARVRPPILPSTVSRRRWRRAAARLSRAPHSARRCAGQAAGGPTHRPPRQSPTHSCALCLTAAGRAAVITARLVLHCPCWLALRPELSNPSHPSDLRPGHSVLLAGSGGYVAGPYWPIRKSRAAGPAASIATGHRPLRRVCLGPAARCRSAVSMWPHPAPAWRDPAIGLIRRPF